MLTSYLIFQPNSEEPERRSIDWPEAPGYARLKQLLSPIIGGGIEHVSVLYEGTRHDMFVDEIGQGKGLPHNTAATALYRAASLARAPRLRPWELPDIKGPAVLFDRQVWF